MYQCYYSPDRCSFLTVECHKYGLSFMSQLPGDHPFKFQVIRALQNLVKLIEGWNKVLFQILKTCGFGTLEMCFPRPVNSLDVCSSKIFFFKHTESSNHLSTENWTANRETELIFLRQQSRAVLQKVHLPCHSVQTPQILRGGGELRASGLSTFQTSSFGNHSSRQAFVDSAYPLAK